MGTLRDRLTYANVMSTIAVFLVLAGGSAIAVINGKKLKNNSVAGKKLKNKAVTEAKLGDKAVTQGKIGEGAVSGSKLEDGAVTGAKLGDGTVTRAKLGGQAVGAAQLDYPSVGLLRSGRIVSSPNASQTLMPPVLSAAGMSLTGSCSLNGGGDHTANVTLSGPAGSVYSGVESGPSIPPTSINGAFASGALGMSLTASGLNSARKQMTVAAATPTSVVNLNILVAINTPDFNTPCLFSATGIVS